MAWKPLLLLAFCLLGPMVLASDLDSTICRLILAQRAFGYLEDRRTHAHLKSELKSFTDLEVQLRWKDSSGTSQMAAERSSAVELPVVLPGFHSNRDLTIRASIATAATAKSNATGDYVFSGGVFEIQQFIWLTDTKEVGVFGLRHRLEAVPEDSDQARLRLINLLTVMAMVPYVRELEVDLHLSDEAQELPMVKSVQRSRVKMLKQLKANPDTSEYSFNDVKEVLGVLFDYSVLARIPFSVSKIYLDWSLNGHDVLVRFIYDLPKPRARIQAGFFKVQ